MFIVFDLLSLNLYQLIAGNGYKGIHMSVIKGIAMQLLIACKFLTSHNIIHCDLKPENVLIKSSSSLDIKVIDLGSACFEYERTYTYIQSRFYRAPEVMLEIPYTAAIDI